MYVLIAGLFAGLYWQNEQRGIEIKRLQGKIEAQKEYFNKKMRTVEFNAVSRIRKEDIEKRIKYDKRSSYDINTTSPRFYLN